MPLPFLVPLLGSMIGTAAAPALGIGTAMAAGAGAGLASLAAGADLDEAMFAGLTAGAGSALLPGIAGAAGKGGEAATQAATGAATESAAQGLGARDLLKAAGQVSSVLGSGPAPAAPVPQGLPMSMNAGSTPTTPAIPQMVQPEREVAAAPVTVPQVTTSSLPPAQGIAALGQDEMRRQGLTELPNLGDPRVAYRMANFARGGFVEGPGTGTSDDIDAMIYQDGEPVQEAALSDGEFVMTANAVKGAGNGDRNKGAAEMYRMMRKFEERAA